MPQLARWPYTEENYQLVILFQALVAGCAMWSLDWDTWGLNRCWSQLLQFQLDQHLPLGCLPCNYGRNQTIAEAAKETQYASALYAGLFLSMRPCNQIHKYICLAYYSSFSNDMILFVCFITNQLCMKNK